MWLVQMPGDAEATVAVDRTTIDRTAIDRTAMEFQDRLVSHLFECGMKLAAVLSRDQVDAEGRRGLQEVIHELDGAIRTVRHAAFARFEREPDPSYDFS